jgi:ankyrin repeat protein
MAADRFTDCPEECEILLKSGAKIDAITTNGKQPLHLACSKGHKETEKLLLSYGADANAVRRNGWTPLHMAAEMHAVKTD